MLETGNQALRRNINQREAFLILKQDVPSRRADRPYVRRIFGAAISSISGGNRIHDVHNPIRSRALLDGFAIPQNWIVDPKGVWRWTQIGYGGEPDWIDAMIQRMEMVKKSE